MRTNTEFREALSEDKAEENTHNVHHFKTTDLEDEYNGMLLQTDA